MKKRSYSTTGYEGIILRGIARQNIFIDGTDKATFIRYMLECAKEQSISVIGYALMNNHVRMQLKVANKEDLSLFVKSLCIRYVRNYFNPRYERCGSLFQNRFKNEEIERDRLAEYNAMLLRASLKGKGKKERVYSSFAETIRAFECGEDEFLDTSELREQISLNDYIALSEKDVFPYLPKLAYTPSRRELSGYLKEFSDRVVAKGSASTIAEQLRILIDSLLRNNISFARVYRLLNSSFKDLLRYAV